jgi:hypothetical protein
MPGSVGESGYVQPSTAWQQQRGHAQLLSKPDNTLSSSIGLLQSLHATKLSFVTQLEMLKLAVPRPFCPTVGGKVLLYSKP